MTPDDDWDVPMATESEMPWWLLIAFVLALVFLIAGTVLVVSGLVP